MWMRRAPGATFGAGCDCGRAQARYEHEGYREMAHPMSESLLSHHPVLQSLTPNREHPPILSL